MTAVNKNGMAFIIMSVCIVTVWFHGNETRMSTSSPRPIWSFYFSWTVCAVRYYISIT